MTDSSEDPNTSGDDASPSAADIPDGSGTTSTSTETDSEDDTASGGPAK